MIAIGMIFAIVLWEFRSEIRVKQHAYTEVDRVEQGEVLKEELAERGRTISCDNEGKVMTVRQVKVLSCAYQ